MSSVSKPTTVQEKGSTTSIQFCSSILITAPWQEGNAAKLATESKRNLWVTKGSTRCPTQADHQRKPHLLCHKPRSPSPKLFNYVGMLEDTSPLVRKMFLQERNELHFLPRRNKHLSVGARKYQGLNRFLRKDIKSLQSVGLPHASPHTIDPLTICHLFILFFMACSYCNTMVDFFLLPFEARNTTLGHVCASGVFSSSRSLHSNCNDLQRKLSREDTTSLRNNVIRRKQRIRNRKKMALLDNRPSSTEASYADNELDGDLLWYLGDGDYCYTGLPSEVYRNGKYLMKYLFVDPAADDFEDPRMEGSQIESSEKIETEYIPSRRKSRRAVPPIRDISEDLEVKAAEIALFENYVESLQAPLESHFGVQAVKKQKMVRQLINEILNVKATKTKTSSVKKSRSWKSILNMSAHQTSVTAGGGKLRKEEKTHEDKKNSLETLSGIREKSLPQAAYTVKQSPGLPGAGLAKLVSEDLENQTQARKAKALRKIEKFLERQKARENSIHHFSKYNDSIQLEMTAKENCITPEARSSGLPKSLQYETPIMNQNNQSALSGVEGNYETNSCKSLFHETEEKLLRTTLGDMTFQVLQNSNRLPNLSQRNSINSIYCELEVSPPWKDTSSFQLTKAVAKDKLEMNLEKTKASYGRKTLKLGIKARTEEQVFTPYQFCPEKKNDLEETGIQKQLKLRAAKAKYPIHRSTEEGYYSTFDSFGGNLPASSHFDPIRRKLADTFEQEKKRNYEFDYYCDKDSLIDVLTSKSQVKLGYLEYPKEYEQVVRHQLSYHSESECTAPLAECSFLTEEGGIEFSEGMVAALRVAAVAGMQKGIQTKLETPLANSPAIQCGLLEKKIDDVPKNTLNGKARSGNGSLRRPFVPKQFRLKNKNLREAEISASSTQLLVPLKDTATSEAISVANDLSYTQKLDENEIVATSTRTSSPSRDLFFVRMMHPKEEKEPAQKPVTSPSNVRRLLKFSENETPTTSSVGKHVQSQEEATKTSKLNHLSASSKLLLQSKLSYCDLRHPDNKHLEGTKVNVRSTFQDEAVTDSALLSRDNENTEICDTKNGSLKDRKVVNPFDLVNVPNRNNFDTNTRRRSFSDEILNLIWCDIGKLATASSLEFPALSVSDRWNPENVPAYTSRMAAMKALDEDADKTANSPGLRESPVLCEFESTKKYTSKVLTQKSEKERVPYTKRKLNPRRCMAGRLPPIKNGEPKSQDFSNGVRKRDSVKNTLKGVLGVLMKYEQRSPSQKTPRRGINRIKIKKHQKMSLV